MLSALRNFMLTFLIATVIFGTIAYFVVGFVLDTLAVTISAESVDETYTTETLPTEETEETAPPEEDEIEGETFNILLIGTDYQPDKFNDYNYEEKWTGSGFPDKRSRKVSADLLVFLRVDKENRKFVFCGLPSNTRVLVDGISMKLGDVYAERGVEYLCGKVSGLTGLEIDYYASLDVGSIASVVDKIGGVSYYIPEDMKYEDPDQDLVIDLKKGTTMLDGDKAEQLLRYVGYSNGASSRLSTAIGFLQAMIAKFTNITYLTKAPELYKSVADYFDTNFTADDLVNNLDLIFSYSKFESTIVSYPGSNKVTDGVNYFEPSTSSAHDMFESYK